MAVDGLITSRAVKNALYNRSRMGRRTEEGESPVYEDEALFWPYSRVLRSTWNSVGIWGDHALRLNIRLH